MKLTKKIRVLLTTALLLAIFTGSYSAILHQAETEKTSGAATGAVEFTISPVNTLTIWDETDTGFPYGDQERYAYDQVFFFSNYTNRTETLSTATCNISFEITPTGPFTMTFNITKYLHEYNRSFDTPGTYNWNVTCNKTSETTLTKSDSVIISSAVPPTPSRGVGRALRTYILTELKGNFTGGIGDKVTFFLFNLEHFVEIIDIGDNNARFRITSEPIEITINEGDAEKIDVTRDRIDDIEIEVYRAGFGSVTFSLGILPQPPPPFCGNGILDPGETSENCCLDAGCPSNFQCVENICLPLPPGICGDGICEPGEEETCPEDCEVVRFVLPRIYIAAITSIIIATILAIMYLYTKKPRTI
jgi:hypothetical protein